MKVSLTTAILISAVAAFPATFNTVVVRDAAEVEARHLGSRDLSQDPLGISKARTNCGPTPCLVFNAAEQFVTTTGEHAYVSPAAGDIRGPCPGLNAAANHGYLPRNGIASIEQTISGLGAAYALSEDACAFLAAYAIALDGNILEGVWSIGGPLPADELAGSLIGTGQGLSYSHNNYEGDASIGRNDAYLNNGDAHSLNIQKFEAVYAVGGKEDRYTLDKFASRFEAVQDQSIATNPYFFTGLFSTVVVVPAAYNFVINLMSNHTAAEPSGYLDGYNFKTFFGVSGKPGSFVWNRGQEHIPPNWYRRPSSTPYALNSIGEDVAIAYAAYPKTLRFGGNLGKPNTFTGVNPGNLTGNVINAQNFFQGDNAQCFFFSLAQQGLPDFLQGGALNKANALIGKYLSPILTKLNCPQLGKADQGLFNQFPGYQYKPKGPTTNYKA